MKRTLTVACIQPASRGRKPPFSNCPPEKQHPYPDTGRRAIPASAVNGKVTLRVLVDRASLEMFVNDGAAAASFVAVPDAKNRALSIEAAGAVKVTLLEVNELKSAWIDRVFN